MKIIRDKTFNTGFLSKITDEPTRFENCIFSGPDDGDGITADVPDCELVNCIIGSAESVSAYQYLKNQEIDGRVYCDADSIKIDPYSHSYQYKSLAEALEAGETEINIK